VPEPIDPRHLTIKHAITARLGVFLLALLLVAGALMTFSPIWLHYVVPPPVRPQSLRYTNLNMDAGVYFPVMNRQGIKPGGTVQMIVAACNLLDRALSVKIQRQIVPLGSDQQGYFLDDATGSWQPGCSAPLISEAHRVPETAAPGEYYLKGTTTPDDGSAPVPWRSETFTVVR
jgi:hypothetical protein